MLMSHWLQIQLNQGFVFNTRLGLAWHRPGELQTAKVWKVSVQFRFSKECHQRTQSKMLLDRNKPFYISGRHLCGGWKCLYGSPSY